ncbi:hypothetical protein HEP87_56850 [Streptomyces sp. S1D4-11]
MPEAPKAAPPTWTWQARSSWPLRCSWCCSSPTNGICGGRHLAVAAGLAVVAVVLLCVWAVIELRSTTPLVDVRAVRHPAVAGANLAMFVGGIGMYLLLTLITRYAQTPHGA